MKTRNLNLAILILAITTLTVSAQDFLSADNKSAESGTIQVHLTVDDAVRIALDNNLSLRQNAIDLGVKKRAQDRSWNSLLPTLGASAIISHPTSVTGPVEPSNMNVWTPGFSISAGFTLSVSVIDTIKKAQADYQSGLLSYEAVNQEIELQVRKLFYQLLLLDSNRELATHNFQNAQSRYEQTAVLARIGQSSKVDELSARVDMENLRPTVINTKTLYEISMDSFKTILGIPAEAMVELDGDLNVEITKNISSVNTGSGDSLEALQLLQSIRSMESHRNSIRSNAYIPNLRLSWSSTPLYNIQNDKWSDNGSFSVSLGINIDNFLPWSTTKTQIDNLNDNIRSAQIQLSDTLRNRNNRINQNIRTIARILESLEAMALNVELAQSTYEMIEDAYSRGAADYQRLRSAGDSIGQARNQLLQEQYNLISTILDLEKEMNIPFGTLSKGE
jgi:outer membrane protein TolC